MKLSARLEKIASMVSPGRVVADIGTDHALIPIKLVGEGITDKCIAMDIGEGPITIASSHINEAGLTDRIETRLSDGFENYNNGDASSIIIAGMGGELIIDIISRKGDKLNAGDELILSPHTHVADVRRYLRLNGFRTVDEAMVQDDGKFYNIIKCVYEPGYMSEADPDEDLFGELLIKQKDECLKLYLEKERNKFKSIMEYLDIISATEKKML